MEKRAAAFVHAAAEDSPAAADGRRDASASSFYLPRLQFLAPTQARWTLTSFILRNNKCEMTNVKFASDYVISVPPMFASHITPGRARR